MDIQAVIVSIDELNKTKNAIANAIRENGVTSQGRFANFPDEIKSIQGGSTGAAYKRIIDNISKYNIFKKNSNNELAAIGRVQGRFEVANTNNLIIYSLYNIENVKIQDGVYKNRIKQKSNSRSYGLKLDGNDCGIINYYTLELSISPIEAEIVNGDVQINYTINGEEYITVMQIQDLRAIKHRDNVYWLTQFKFNPVEDSKDLKQFTSMQNAEDGYAIFDGGTSLLQWSETRPSVFDMLNHLSGGQSIDAVLAFEKNGDLIESMPVKLVKSIQTKRIPIAPNQNAAVLELENDKLVFHYSDDAGRLNAKCVVATKEWATTTDASILDKVKKLNDAEYSYICIAVDDHGNPISYEEAKKAGML